MKRRPILKISVFAGAASLLAALGVGGLAWARGAHGGCGGREAFMKKMVSAKIDDALDYAHVDDAQRAKIHQIRDDVFTQMAANRPNREEHLKAVKELFLADTVDKSKIDAFRAQRQEKMEKMADVFENAFIQAHDVLTPAQRAKVVEYVEKQQKRWHED